MNKKVLTGIKPTGRPHLGNYIGAIKPALSAAQESDKSCYYFIADYHALNSITDPKELKLLTYDVAATWLAMGLDPEKVCFYRQSEIPEIFEIQTILTTVTSKGLMNRAHAYKAAKDKNVEAGKSDLDYGINMGLYVYPILMAADILCVNSDFVPVGKDQVQHVEIARDLAQRFNSMFGEVFKLPSYTLTESGEVIPGLDGRKMSKSYDNTIPLFETPKKRRKLVNQIKTTSKEIDDPFPPDECNVFNLFRHFAQPDHIKEIRESYAKGISWGAAKEQLNKVLGEVLEEPREKYLELLANEKKVDEILSAGAERVRKDASRVLSDAKSAVGIK